MNKKIKSLFLTILVTVGFGSTQTIKSDPLITITTRAPFSVAEFTGGILLCVVGIIFMQTGTDIIKNKQKLKKVATK